MSSRLRNMSATEFETFKNAINQYGKQIRVTFDVDDETFLEDRIVSTKLSYQGRILTSVMRELEIEFTKESITNDNFSGKVLSNVTFYVYDDEEETESSIVLGNFICKESSYNVANDSIKCVCYDDLLQTMVPYDLAISESDFPISVGDYFKKICNRFEWDCTDADFTNKATLIDGEKFDETYTYRDVLDSIAQVVGGIIAFGDGKLNILYPYETGEVIDESNLKSLTIGEHYGVVNSLVLSRTPQEDNIYIQDAESIEANGLCEIKIENNQIMDSDRDAFINELFVRLNGLEYCTYEMDSFGIAYLDLCDIFTIETVDGTLHKTMVLCDELNITQGMSEKVSASTPEITETEYNYADEKDRVLNQTLLRVDKQSQQISGLITKTETVADDIEDVNTRIAELTKSVSATMTEEQIEILINETVKTVGEVTTSTGYKFNKDGLLVSKVGADTETLIDEDGMDISSYGEKVLIASSQGVNAKNLTSRQYLTIGTYSRFEDYDNGDDSQRTGCFMLGGN